MMEPIVIDGERYKIEPTSCRCGGTHAWLRERPSGAWEMVGCVCHHLPGTKTVYSTHLQRQFWGNGPDADKPKRWRHREVTEATRFAEWKDGFK